MSPPPTPGVTRNCSTQPAVEPLAQTTVQYPHQLLKRARVRAANDEISLRSLLITALEAELERRDKRDEQRRARADRRLAAKRG
jgi:hypothetical protein